MDDEAHCKLVKVQCKTGRGKRVASEPGAHQVYVSICFCGRDSPGKAFVALPFLGSSHLQKNFGT